MKFSPIAIVDLMNVDQLTHIRCEASRLALEYRENERLGPEFLLTASRLQALIDALENKVVPVAVSKPKRSRKAKIQLPGGDGLLDPAT